MPALVTPVDPATAALGLLCAMHEVFRSCHEKAIPEEPYRSESDTVAFIRHPPASEERRYWIAQDETERVVALACLFHVPGNTAGYAEVMVVPGQRRRGFGTALMETVTAAARQSSLTAVVAKTADPDGHGFAASIGAGSGRHDVRQALRLGARRLQVTDRTRGAHRIESWSGRTPDSLLESYAQARNAIDDAPHSEGTSTLWTPAMIRDLEDALVRRGRSLRIHVIVDGNEKAIGFTEIRVSPEPGAVAATEDTAIVRAFRGRGFATWLKMCSLFDLAMDRPDVELITTTNAVTNAPILAVNRRLGFVAIAELIEHRLELALADAPARNDVS